MWRSTFSGPPDNILDCHPGCRIGRQNVDLIVAPGGAPVALAAKGTGTTKTIVFEMGGDPVQLRVVDSLSRPGGNITGVSSLSVDVSQSGLS